MSQRVVILEDNEDLRSALERFVQRRGLVAHPVGTVADALRILESGEGDLLISDIRLPDGSGLELIEHLRSAGFTLPTILITGLPDMALAAQGMKAGAVDFLTKPMDLDELGAVMDRSLERARRRRAADGAGPSPEVEGDRPRLVGRHPAIVELFKKIGAAAGSSAPVLIRGESGTGKELVAREIHRHSRPGKPFVAMNCASISDSLLESELFGHEKGAFTGALASRRGRFELASDGTLFLDEIGDASSSFQSAILRALQEGEYLPVGGERTKPVHARFIAATHRPLEEKVSDGSFRADLFYRIQVLELDLPPLRERISDLPELITYLLERSAARAHSSVPEVSTEAMQELLGHPWPGNVRELENVLERAVVNARWDVILPEHVELPSPASLESLEVERSRRGTVESAAAASRGTGGARTTPDAEALDEAMRRHAEQVLERAGGNKREAARRLGISPGRLYRILDPEQS